jgi:hypothetical protein
MLACDRSRATARVTPLASVGRVRHPRFNAVTEGFMALPLLLAGPIVRRVEPRLVTVWVALGKPATVTVPVWKNLQTAGSAPGSVTSGDATYASGQATTRRIGKALHVAVVTVRLDAPMQPLQPGALYSYNVVISGTGLPTTDLRALDLLKTPNPPPPAASVEPGTALPQPALGYAVDRLPSFATCPPTLQDLRLAQASCRKAGGRGADAFAWLDDVIKKTVDSPLARPHQLYLTGDQIYADDVPASLLPALNEIGRELFGPESLPVSTPSAGLQDHDGSIANFPATRRQELIWEVAKFTSGSGHNHIMTLGEFCALYLCAWSPDIWRPLAAVDDVFQLVPSTHPLASVLTPWDSLYKDIAERKKWREQSFLDERDRTRTFWTTVGKVRRALANVPTYMIFDDHDVTDDWNLTQTWKDRTLTSPLGRTITRNGMLAYAVFQGWGNDPARFEAGKNKEVLDQLEALFPDGGGPPVAAAANAIDVAIGISPPPPTAEDKSVASWHYTVDGPRHRTVVLDTRTRRKFSGRVSPPHLLGGGTGGQVPGGPLTDGRELLVVVSPTPVLSPFVIERLVQPLVAAYTDFSAAVRVGEKKDHGAAKTKKDEDPGKALHYAPSGAARIDVEGWSADEAALEDILGALIPYGRVVALSGDVHHGAGMELDYWRKGVTAPSRIVQLTSSSARNSFDDKVEAVTRASTLGYQLMRIGLPAVRLAWKSKADDNVILAAGESLPTPLRARWTRSPVLAFGRGWPVGTTLNSEKLPDWRWRMDMLADPRPNSERPPGLQTPNVTTDFTTADPIDGYFRVGANHGLAAAQHVTHFRRLLFLRNIGLVSFPRVGTEQRVRHELLSDHPSLTFAPNTVHEASLDPTGDPAPELEVANA